MKSGFGLVELHRTDRVLWAPSALLIGRNLLASIDTEVSPRAALITKWKEVALKD